MDYKKLTVAAALMGASMIYAQDAEIATWSGFRKGAVSFTFDDSAPSQVSDAAPMFDGFGYKATFNLITGGWGNTNWNGFGEMAKNGHEMASHSASHPGGVMDNGEIASSKKDVNDHIQQTYGCITLAYPNCKVPSEQQVLQNYVVGRICNGSWEGVPDVSGKDGPSNWAKAPALMTGTTGINSTNDYTNQMKQAITNNGWVSFLTHGFQGKNNGSADYSPTDINAMKGALQWAQQNDKDIWVAPMGHVAMYIKERKASQVSASTSGSTTTVKLTHNIKDKISDYDYPLTLKVKTSLSKAEVTQAGAKLESKTEGGYVIFDAVPNAGDIVIAGEGAGPSSSSSEASSSSAAPDQSSSSGTPQAIAEIQADFHISVYRSSDNYIVVGGAQGMNITVFNSLGHQVRTTRGLGAVQKVYTGAKGVYVVKVGSKSYKVKL